MSPERKLGESGWSASVRNSYEKRNLILTRFQAGVVILYFFQKLKHNEVIVKSNME